MKKFIALALALCMASVMSVCSFATEIKSDGGAGSTPVYLSSTEDGTLDGNPSATAMSVTVPTVLPMAMAQNGDVTTADNCKIINNSYGTVRVKSVTITAENGWKLTPFGSKSTLASEKLDSNKLGFAMTIGGGKEVMTKGNASTQRLISAPEEGCYMTGIGDTTGNTAVIEYAAIVTPMSGAVNNTTIANVVFVIEWVMVD